MGYVSFRGVSTEALGVFIAKGGMPSHVKAKTRATEYEIPGRNGAVHVIDGYSPFDLAVTLQLMRNDAHTRQLINAWADGTGELFSSDDTQRVWQATVIRAVEYKRAEYGGAFYDTAKVIFRCQPFMRERMPEVVELTASGTLRNIGNVEALPQVVVHGSGDCTVTIGTETIRLEGVDGSVTIDSETGYVYSAEGAVAMEGEFPVLGLGDTAVSFGGGVTSLEITPHWGWI